MRMKRDLHLSVYLNPILSAQIRDHPVEDADLFMHGTINEIDPITKGALLNPVRNIKCNHIYGRDSVQNSLRINPRLR